jgi:hypothetical protein
VNFAGMGDPPHFVRTQIPDSGCNNSTTSIPGPERGH